MEISLLYCAAMAVVRKRTVMRKMAMKAIKCNQVQSSAMKANGC